MAGVINHTARQLNMKACDKKGARVSVRLKPGFNVVDDKHWAVVAKSDYAKVLKKRGWIDFGKKTLNEEAELADADTTAQSKSTPADPVNTGDADEEEEEAEAEDEE